MQVRSTFRTWVLYIVFALPLTASTQTLLQQFPPANELAFSVNLEVGEGLALFFFGGRDSTLTLWRTDGTPAGTRELRRFASSTPPLHRLLVVDGQWFFGLSEHAVGAALWTSDGTTEGTQPLAEFGRPPQFLTAFR
ncbi:MAG: hypothetical protein KDC32_06285, partial [Saprospiraceae bacterium]|nr:hypothetical protein [Saprospiraceae bacterium]